MARQSCQPFFFLGLVFFSCLCCPLRAEKGSGAETAASGNEALNCEELGFTGLALCSDCETLSEYVKDKELEADCKRCCAREAEDSISKAVYGSAVLEVCERKLSWYRQVEEFVGQKARVYPKLIIRFRPGAPPRLLLTDDAGKQKESIRIDNWKTEHIEEFLKGKLKAVK